VATTPPSFPKASDQVDIQKAVLITPPQPNTTKVNASAASSDSITAQDVLQEKSKSLDQSLITEGSDSRFEAELRALYAATATKAIVDGDGMGVGGIKGGGDMVKDNINSVERRRRREARQRGDPSRRTPRAHRRRTAAVRT
jgi:bifunctional ADP-heptose synthase (sugar kinase/adenylyltransferase)